MRRRHLPSDPFAGFDPRLAPLLGIATIAVLAAADAILGPGQIITATVVLGPFLTALGGSARTTLGVAVVAVAVAALSGIWNHNFFELDYFVRVVLVSAGGALALVTAEVRERLATDRRRFRLLTGVARVAQENVSVEEAADRVGDLLVPELADICVIDVERDGEVRRLKVRAHGPRAAEVEAGLRRRAEAGTDADAAPAMRSGRPHLIAEATEEHARRAARDDEDLAFLRSMGGRSTVITPLTTRGGRIGSMALMLTDVSGRRYDEADLDFAEVLGARVALTLDNVGLFREVGALEAQLTAAISGLAEAVTVQAADGSLVYANQAAADALGFPDADALVATPPREIIDRFESFTEDGRPLELTDLPGRRVFAGEEPPPLLVRAVDRATGEERWRVVKATPVPGDDGTPRLAVNVFEDVTEVKRAEVAQRFLSEAGALLASSLDYEETLRQVARLAVPQLADWCGVSIPDDRGVIRSVAVAHVDPGKVEFAREYNAKYPTRLSDAGGAAEVIRTGVSQLVPDIPDELLEQAVEDPEQRAELRRLGMRSVMIVPMVVPTGVIGVISFVTAESARVFTQGDLALAEELARRAGTAVENSRLYTERSAIAQTLQASLLPADLPDVPGASLAAMYRPAGQENWVGGDFYDVFPTPAGWMVLVGDVAGHGAPAAALTAQARHTLRTAAEVLGDPAQAVDQLNAALTQRPSLAICTVALALIDEAREQTEAAVVCAGQPLPLRVRDGRAEPVGDHAEIVGAWPDAHYTAERISLHPGDLLVLFTDGVIDARGEHERFGEARLTACLAGATDADEAVDRIRDALDAFEVGPRADDTAVVAVRYAERPVAAP